MILVAAGTSLNNVLKVLTHLTQREDLAAYNEEYRQVLPDRQTSPDHGGSDVELPRTPCGNNRHGLYTRIGDFAVVRMPRIEVESMLRLGPDSE